MASSASLRREVSIWWTAATSTIVGCLPQSASSSRAISTGEGTGVDATLISALTAPTAEGALYYPSGAGGFNSFRGGSDYTP